MGGVVVRKHVYDAFMKGPEHAIELFTAIRTPPSARLRRQPCALDVYRYEKLFERALALESKWCDALLTLKGLPNVLDIRCVGLTGAIDLAPSAAGPGERAMRRSNIRSTRPISCFACRATRSS